MAAASASVGSHFTETSAGVNDLAAVIDEMERSTVAIDDDFRSAIKCDIENPAELLEWFKSSAQANMVKDLKWCLEHSRPVKGYKFFPAAEVDATKHIVRRITESKRRILRDDGYFYFHYAFFSPKMPTEAQLERTYDSWKTGSRNRATVSRIIGKKAITYPMIVAMTKSAATGDGYFIHLGLWMAIEK